MNAITNILQWWPFLFLAVLGVSIWRATLDGISIWRSTRRLARLSASESKIRRDDTREIRTNAPFRRRDFAAKAEIVRKETVKGTAIMMVILVAWGPSLVAISRLVPTLPRGSLIAYQAILFVAAMGSYLAFTARGSRLARSSGLICPACGMELAGVRQRGRRSADLVQDRVLETGKCPGCRAQLLDPSEVGSGSQTLTRGEHAKYIGIIAAMVTAIIVMLYFAPGPTYARYRSRCRDLYAHAYTDSDSVVVDSTRLDRRDRVTCRYFRRSNKL